jgi:oxygen-independent coproporphyrinogen-3 oxidase
MPKLDLPLALYVHMPWCVRKCPYCDFNSHGLRGEPDYARYVDCLLADLDGDLADFAGAVSDRPIASIFFGGGTPSLVAPALIGHFLAGVRARLTLADDCEITLETNPGTVEHGNFEGYLAAGINRLSLGIQSFDDEALRRLGRIHSAAEAENALRQARAAGFDNINLDLMYALPRQTLAGALTDVDRAIALAPAHISHYQLTIEPRTAFARHPPPLPTDDAAWDMQEACQAHLASAGYAQYEVSAYARAGRRCRHNLNYWAFGDYLGIGAGAHGKLSSASDGQALWIRRRWKRAMPLAYMKHAHTAGRIEGEAPVAAGERPLEYMLNALRLIDGTALAQFTVRTGLPLNTIAGPLAEARKRGWLHDDVVRLKATEQGQRFLNDVIGVFMQ